MPAEEGEESLLFFLLVDLMQEALLPPFSNQENEVHENQEKDSGDEEKIQREKA